MPRWARLHAAVGARRGGPQLEEYARAGGESSRQASIRSKPMMTFCAHDPGHILLEAACADAATRLLPLARHGEFLRRIKGRIRYKAVELVSPLAVAVPLGIDLELVRKRGVAKACARPAQVLRRGAIEGG